MAQRGAERETLTCSICLNLLKEPVTIPCGHNFCKTCISRRYEEENNNYSCPQCRKRFRSRPVLLKNTALENLVEDLKRRRDISLSTAAEDVVCDFCTEGKRKASKSCLTCMDSYCEKHLQPHHELIELKRHKLVDPSKKNYHTVEVLPTPMTRAELLNHSKGIILDPNTAYIRLQLSEENRKVTRIKERQRYPDHPERFTEWYQVLSRESLTGRCYWEVEWRGKGVELGVAYKSISRTGNGFECKFGFNEKSWSLRFSSNIYSFFHNSIHTRVSGPQSSRIGVYVDHSAGILSFYSVSEKMTLLHRVKTTFTEPLHAGVSVDCDGDSVRFGDPC